MKNIKKILGFKKAVLNSTEHIMITNPEGIILFANHAAEKMTGFNKKEIIGKKAGTKDLWGGQMDEAFYKKMWQKIKIEKKVFHGIIKNKKKNGKYYFAQTSVAPVLDKNGNIQYFVGNEHDITKELEIDRIKTEFISLASHQLKTPLTRIKIVIEELLKNKGNLDKEQKKYLRIIKESSADMFELIDMLINISKLESGKIVLSKEQINLKNLINEVVETLKEENHKIFKKYSLKNTNIIGDNKFLKELYKNLLTNAIKYTPKKGKITILIKESKGTILSEIKDTGIGIPEKDKKRIFEKFFRASNSSEGEKTGNGLGLYLVKQIVEAAGGKIWFKSKLNQGTSFYFTIQSH